MALTYKYVSTHHLPDIYWSLLRNLTLSLIYWKQSLLEVCEFSLACGQKVLQLPNIASSFYISFCYFSQYTVNKIKIKYLYTGDFHQVSGLANIYSISTLLILKIHLYNSAFNFIRRRRKVNDISSYCCFSQEGIRKSKEESFCLIAFRHCSSWNKAGWNFGCYSLP